MSDETIVKFGSPTLAGLKTGNIFTCEYTDLHELSGQLRDLNRKLVPRGLRLIPLRWSKRRVLLYLYRPDRLKEDAARKTFERFDKCTRIYCRRWSEGVPLTRLAVAGVK